MIKNECKHQCTSKSIFVTANNIWVLTDFIKEVEEELEELQGQKKKLEDTIHELGDTKKQVMMYRIKGFSLSEIADKMNYSKRHIERMMAGIKKRSVKCRCKRC